jgi:hypothetical protein
MATSRSFRWTVEADPKQASMLGKPIEPPRPKPIEPPRPMKALREAILPKACGLTNAVRDCRGERMRVVKVAGRRICLRLGDPNMAVVKHMASNLVRKTKGQA